MYAADRDALICDMAEYYHVLEWRELPLKTAAALAAGLRDDSRSMMGLSKSKVSSDTLLKALMVDRLGLLVWAKTKDAQKGRNKPKSIIDSILRSDEQQTEKKAKVKSNTAAFKSGADFEAARARILKGG